MSAWRRFLAAAVVAAGVAMAQAGHAAVIDWTLSGGQFDDGGAFSGTFSFDTALDQVTSWAINTTRGTIATGAPFGANYTTGGGDTAAVNASSILFTQAAGVPYLNLTGFSPGSHGSFAIGGAEVAENFTGDGQVQRNVTAGIASTAVPEPASWALLVAGIGLGGALLRRRRQAAFAA